VKKTTIGLLAALALSASAEGQIPRKAPDNELSVPLPGLWRDGAQPRTAREWEYVRKPELLELFSAHVYGRTPEGGSVSKVETISRDEAALDGLATMSQMRITFRGPLGEKTGILLLYVPNRASAATPAPVFVGLNFLGNHTTTADPTIELVPGWWAGGQRWVDEPKERAAEERSWPVRIPLERGYAVATMHYADLEPDSHLLAAKGVRALFHSKDELDARRPDMWGAVGAWAWGLSRILDVLTDIPEIDATAAIVFGHSRLGKTALWAAAQDPRFAAAIANNSGTCGAGLFRHPLGQTIANITGQFPHWFCTKLASYADDALAQLPVDQHQLLGLIAPRPIHVTSATADAYRPDFLTTVFASPVMELYGHHGTLPPGLAEPGVDVNPQTASQQPVPKPGTRIGGRLSFHLRDGLHDLLAEDWQHFVNFADENVHRAKQWRGDN